MATTFASPWSICGIFRGAMGRPGQFRSGATPGTAARLCRFTQIPALASRDLHNATTKCRDMRPKSEPRGDSIRVTRGELPFRSALNAIRMDQWRRLGGRRRLICWRGWRLRGPHDIDPDFRPGLRHQPGGRAGKHIGKQGCESQRGSDSGTCRKPVARRRKLGHASVMPQMPGGDIHASGAAIRHRPGRVHAHRKINSFRIRPNLPRRNIRIFWGTYPLAR